MLLPRATPLMPRRSLRTLLAVSAAGALAGAAMPLSHAQSTDGPRILTDRTGARTPELTTEEDGFLFAVFGDRTGGPPEGIEVLAEAVAEVNLIDPDLVMTVGDLIKMGYGVDVYERWRGLFSVI